MSRDLRNLLWFACAMVVTMLIVGQAYAAMTIEICGSSSYTCSENDAYDQPGVKSGKVTLSNTAMGASPTPTTSIGVSTVTGSAGYVGETPSGWTSPTQPPSSTAQVASVYFATSLQATAIQNHETGPFTGDPTGACADLGANAAKYGVPAGTYSWNAGTGYCQRNGSNAYPPLSTVLCPAGYTIGSTTCTLSNASVVQKPKDGVCNILRNGNTYSGDPNDPDCAANSVNSTNAQALGNPTASGGTVTAVSPNGKTFTASIEADGSLTVTVASPNMAKGTTTTTTVKFGPPDATGAPTVTGLTKSETSGIGSLATPAGSGGSGAGMTDATGQAIKGVLDGIKSNSDAQKAKEESVPSGAGFDTGARSQLDAAEADREAKLANVTSGSGKDTTWGWTPDLGAGSGCSPVQMGDWSIDICTQVPRIQSIVGWLWYAFTAFTVIGMVGNTIRRA